MKNLSVTRRTFIEKSTRGGAALMVGGMLPNISAKSYNNIIGSNERIRVAVIGVNSRGRALAMNFANQRNCEVSYVCDVDTRANERCAAAVSKAQTTRPQLESDFRRLLEYKDVDAVVIATPDHWHAPMTIMACDAGKHVYVEKPFSNTPYEGELLIAIEKKYDKSVIQIGNQRRSWPNVLSAIEEIHRGVIGRPYFGKGWYANNRPSIGVGKETAVPDWLDYDLWQGPVPRRPYKDNLIHYNWHWFWHYGKGELPGNGVHVLDLLRWGMQVDYPTRITSSGGRYRYNDDWETPDTQTVNIEFGSDLLMSWEGRSCNGVPFYNNSVGAMFYGEKGSLLIGGGNHYTIFDLKNKIIKEVKSEVKTNTMNRMNPSHQLDALHIQDFFEGIRKGIIVKGNVTDGHKSTLLCQLGNIALLTGDVLHINPEDGRICDNQKAMAYWSRDYEPGWEPKL